MTINHLSLLKNIDIKELLNEAPFLCIFENDETAHETLSIDSVAYLQTNQHSLFMSLKKLDVSKIKPAKAKWQYWEPVKKQIHLLFCTDDTRYDKLRQKIKHLKTPVATSIAAYVGAKIGVEPTKIIGFCVICIYFAVKIHKEAFCEELKNHIE